MVSLKTKGDSWLYQGKGIQREGKQRKENEVEV